MILDFAALPEGTLSRELSSPPEALHLQTDICRFDQPVTMGIVAHKTHDELMVQGTVSTLAIATCVRCLEQFTISLNEPFRAVASVVPDADVTADTGDEDFYLLPQSAPIWDLSGLAHDLLLLAVPDNPLCHEDCAGICPGCGRNLNLEVCVCAKRAAEGPLAALGTLLDMRRRARG